MQINQPLPRRVRCALIWALLLSVQAGAQSGGEYQITTALIGSGQDAAQGDQYSLQGSTSQAVTGDASGGVYTLLGGHWTRNRDLIFFSDF